LRAFYRMKNGARRDVDHRYFFGKLRAAHVAREGAIRTALVGPVGFWFGRELFLEADVNTLIATAKAEPSRKGAPKQYDHTNAIIALIDHPKVRALDCQSACKRDPLSARKRDPLSRWRKVDRTRAFALRAA